MISNLSGIWKLLLPGQVRPKYLDVPQNFDSRRRRLVLRGRPGASSWSDMAPWSGREPDSPSATWRPRSMRSTTRTAEARRGALRPARRRSPGCAPTSEVYLLLRAGMVLPVEEHSELVLGGVPGSRSRGRTASMVDNARVLLNGAFCEQPPLTLIRTLERSGCEVVDDDFLPDACAGWAARSERGRAIPIEALARPTSSTSGESASPLRARRPTKGERMLVERRRCGAEGVVFAAPELL